MEEFKTLTEYNWLYWLAGLIILLNCIKWGVTLFEWFIGKLGIETKRTRREKSVEDRLGAVESAVKKLEANAKNNVDDFMRQKQEVVDGISKLKDEIIEEFAKLHNKIDEQKKENDETDRVMLRDRIAGGMRYFSQNKDEDGNVHISFADYTNMDALFERYFAKDGNGPFEEEYKVFKTFKRDR